MIILSGVYRIKFKSGRLTYDLTIKDKVTFINDYSATGKTNLVNAIELSNKIRSKFKIDVYEYKSSNNGEYNFTQCDKKLNTISGDIETLEYTLNINNVNSPYYNRIVFVDEDITLYSSKYFSKAISENYPAHFVIISRSISNYGFLSFSIDSIKILYNNKQNKTLTLENKYDIDNFKAYNSVKDVTHIITEDEGSGNLFYKSFVDKGNCIAAKSKFKICSTVNNVYNINNDISIMVVVDKCAYGCHIEDLLSIIGANKKIFLFSPRSFEFLLLQHNYFSNITELNDIKQNIYVYIDGNEELYWEKLLHYYIELVNNSFNRKLSYSKTNLSIDFLSDKFKEYIYYTYLNSINFIKLTCNEIQELSDPTTEETSMF